MPMHTMLDLPEKHPRWATDALTTLEPSEGRKDVGWSIDSKAPARWMNWFMNLVGEWTKKIGSTIVSNWYQNDDAGAVDFNAIIYHPDNGVWIKTGAGVVATYSSLSGNNWGAVGNLSAFSALLSIGIDTSYTIAGTVVGTLEYSADGVAWTTVASGTIGGAGDVYTLATKYGEADDMLICLRNNSAPRIGATGVTGAYVAASTPPTSKSVPIRILHRTGTHWITLSADATNINTLLSVSADDGDVWADSAVDPTASSKFYDMAYNGDSGRIVIVGETTGSVPTAEYTDDLGSTWTVATMSADATLTQELNSVYYCGGGMWVAAGQYTGGYINRLHIQVSVDDGETWNLADVMLPGSLGTPDGFCIGCDGRKMIIGCSGGENFSSLSVI